MTDMQTDVKETVCAGCHRARSQWRTDNSVGFSKGGKLYCCEGCANGGHCTCDLRQTAPLLERNQNETEGI